MTTQPADEKPRHSTGKKLVARKARDRARYSDNRATLTLLLIILAPILFAVLYFVFWFVNAVIEQSHP